MTSQLNDTVYYQDEAYALIGVKGDKLPTPQDYEMTPVGGSSFSGGVMLPYTHAHARNSF